MAVVKCNDVQSEVGDDAIDDDDDVRQPFVRPVSHFLESQQPRQRAQLQARRLGSTIPPPSTPRPPWEAPLCVRHPIPPSGSFPESPHMAGT